MRNHRGLKPFQLARANGHSTIARQLCDTRSSQARRTRRRRNAGGGGATPAKATTPEALLTMLIQVHMATALYDAHIWVHSCTNTSTTFDVFPFAPFHRLLQDSGLCLSSYCVVNCSIWFGRDWVLLHQHGNKLQGSQSG